MSRLIDWENVCLVCLQKGENRFIFDLDNDSNVIADKIMKCADILIKIDANQPKNICLHCLDDLNVAYTFCRNCEQSDSIIKAHLNSNHQFEIKDLRNTTPITLKPIRIKDEILDGSVVEESTPCLDSEAATDTETKFDFECPTSDCIHNSTVEPNNVKTNGSKKTAQEANTENPGRPRGRPVKSTKSIYKIPHKICEICNQCFRYQHALDIHMRRHNNDRPFTCDHCGKSFVSTTDLSRHMRVHTGQKPYKCQYCDRRFAEKCNRKSHERTHTGEKPYVCPTCGKNFTYSYALEEHRQTHPGVKKFVCKECGKGFDKKKFFEGHVALHTTRDIMDKSSEHNQKKMPEKVLKIECNNSNEINIKQEIVDSNVVDDVCDNETSSCLDLENDPDNQKAIELSNVKTNERNKTKKEANKQTLRRLRGQSKTLTGISCANSNLACKNPIKTCEICNRCFNSQHNLDIHMRRHKDERPFRCDHCDKAFVSTTDLRRHMKVHTGQKPYQCQYCDHRFAERSNRKTHERTHAGERPFVCPTCGKSFTYSHVLTKHRQIHTTAKKFVCDECGKVFNRRKFLERHVRRHLSRDKLDKSLEHKQKKVVEREIFQIEECAKSNEINIKHEVELIEEETN